MAEANDNTSSSQQAEEAQTQSFGEILLAAGVSEAAVTILIGEEFDAVDQLSNITYQQFVDLGIKAKSADILTQKFGNNTALSAQPIDAGSTPQAINVTVQTEMPLEDKSVSDLLNIVIADSSNADAIEALLAKPSICKASVKTKAWVIPIAGKRASVDVLKTLAYLVYLGKPTANALDRYEGQRPITIEVALGIEEKVLANPFTDEPITSNLDSDGNNWMAISREFMKAVKWARQTKHTLFAPLDTFDAFTEASAETHTARWSRILDDYRDAVENEDEVALGISLVYKGGAGSDSVSTGNAGGTLRQPVDVLSNMTTRSGGGVIQTAQQTVSDKAGDKKIASSNHGNVTGAYREIEVMGDHVTLSNVIVLTSCVIRGNHVRGNLYLAPGASVSITGNHSDVSEQRCSWEELAQKV